MSNANDYISAETLQRYLDSKWHNIEGAEEPLKFSFHSALRAILPQVATHLDSLHIKSEYRKPEMLEGITKIEHAVAELDGNLRPSLKSRSGAIDNPEPVNIAFAKETLGKMKALYNPDDRMGKHCRETVDEVCKQLGLGQNQEITL